MYVKVGEGKDGLQRALRIFSKLVKRSELMQEIKNRQFFLKPSKKKKFKRNEALKRRKREERRLARHKKYYN